MESFVSVIGVLGNNEYRLLDVIVDKSKIELACQNKWDELAKQYNEGLNNEFFK